MYDMSLSRHQEVGSDGQMSSSRYDMEIFVLTHLVGTCEPHTESTDTERSRRACGVVTVELYVV